MIVYALIDPRTREIRYVGETVLVGDRRLKQHLRSAAKRTVPPVNAWMRGLLNAGLAPDMVEIEASESVEAMHESEAHWIEQFRAMGAALLNVAPGGSTRKGYRHSEETKAKWRRERRGEKSPMYGKRRTPEQKAMFAEIARKWHAEHPNAQVGRKLTEECKRKISESRKGVKAQVSEDGQRRMDEARRKRWENPSYREKMVRPGLRNANAREVVVDGVSYAIAELSRACGLGRNVTRLRVNKYQAEGRQMTMADFQRVR